jgi:hypothetical protein
LRADGRTDDAHQPLDLQAHAVAFADIALHNLMNGSHTNEKFIHLNTWMVECWFALLTECQLRCGVHRSTKEMKAAIDRFIQHCNANPKPFIWHKTADQILDSVAAFL